MKKITTMLFIKIILLKEVLALIKLFDLYII